MNAGAGAGAGRRVLQELEALDLAAGCPGYTLNKQDAPGQLLVAHQAAPHQIIDVLPQARLSVRVSWYHVGSRDLGHPVVGYHTDNGAIRDAWMLNDNSLNLGRSNLPSDEEG